MEDVDGDAAVGGRTVSGVIPHPPKTADRVAALLPPCFFAPAIVAFAAALAAAPALLDDVHDHFYQAHVLALVHTLTLGWISMVMIGVLYRYVAGLTKVPVPRPRAAVAQWATYVTGTTALVTGFWTGDWALTAGAAGMLAVSVVLLATNLWPMLAASPKRGVAEVGIALATAFFFAAAVLGTLLAVDKMQPFLRGHVLTNLGAHAHLAGLGWVGTTIAALAFRFLPAFLFASLDLTAAARRIVVVLAGGVVLLAATLLAGGGTAPAAAVVATTLAVWVVQVVRMLRSHRLPFDWTTRHAMAAVAWCATAIVLGIALVGTGLARDGGPQLAAAYGTAGLLGWMSNLVVGISYKLFPGFVVATRTALGRRPIPITVLLVPAPLQIFVFVAFNAGTAAVVASLLTGNAPAGIAGAVALAAAAVAYAAATARTLLRTATDPPPWSPLEVLP